MTSADLLTSLASPPSAPRLPVELLAQIVDEATSDRSTLDYTTLRQLCLTSRNILTFARQALYLDISITFYDAFVHSPAAGSLVEEETLADEERWITHNGEKLQATLVGAPHLAQLVTGLTLHLLNHRRTAVDLPRRTITDLLRLCPRLTALRVPDPFTDEAEAVVAELRRDLPGMVELWMDASPDLLLLLASSPQLRRLHLGVGDDTALEIGDEVAFPFRLSNLDIDERDFEMAGDVAQRLLRCSRYTLRHLAVHVDLASHLPDLLPQLLVLSHLQLRLWGPDDDCALCEQLSDALSRCQALRSLHLVGSILPFSDVMITRLPPQLSSIRFQEAVKEGALETLLSDESRGALRQVVMDYGDEHDWEKLGAEHGWLVERFGEKVVFAR